MESTACWRVKVEQTDRQALTFLIGESHSRLFLPPDTNSRLCFTFTSICREARGRQRGCRNSQPYQISHFFYLSFSYKLSLSFPSSVCLSCSHTLTYSATVSLPPSIPPSSSLHSSLLSSSVIPSESLLRFPPLCNLILF